eukprot:4506347-Prorocentrum_lima.AAC.1
MNYIKPIAGFVRHHHKIDSSWSGAWFSAQMYATLALRPEQRLEGTIPPPAQIAAATPRVSVPPTPI